VIVPQGKEIVPTRALPSLAVPAAVNNPWAIALAAPEVVDVDMTWTCSVPEPAGRPAGIALAAVTPVRAMAAAAATVPAAV